MRWRRTPSTCSTDAVGSVAESTHARERSLEALCDDVNGPFKTSDGCMCCVVLFPGRFFLTCCFVSPEKSPGSLVCVRAVCRRGDSQFDADCVVTVFLPLGLAEAGRVPPL